MRKPKYFVLSIVIGIITGISAGKITKRKQYLAEIAGKHIPFGPYEIFLKRPLDILLAGSLSVLLSPIMGITALLIKIKLGSPVFFIQQRPGLNEKIFKIYKFRSMSNEKDKDGNFLPDKKRLTKFGRILRSMSLDELPELFNIIKGDMSIIGPRPLITQYLPYYTNNEHHRHDVKPGLTGLAQIHGRNNLSWEKRFEYDLQYVNKITFCNDFMILLKTILKVIKKENVTVREEGNLLDFDLYRNKQYNKNGEL